MRFTVLLAFVVSLCSGCEEETLDEYNELLPLDVGVSYEFNSDSDDSVWTIDVMTGAGIDGEPSYRFEFEADGAPQYRHDLYLGEDENGSGWVEVEPDAEDLALFVKLPAEVGDEWSHEIILNGNGHYWTAYYDERVNVSVPAGDFEQAWVLVRDYQWSMDNDTLQFHNVFEDYYAPGVGLVKRVFTNSDGEDTTLSLTDYALPGAEEE